MSVSSHYKGDVSEATMGHETGLYIEHNEPLTWSATDGADHTVITFATAAGAAGNTFSPLGVGTGAAGAGGGDTTISAN